jgi:prolyl-tRNA editing enzyme YbaK/EbsC (Cys-tRNA(Pro) deacylase)
VADWPEAVERVARFLTEAGAEARVEEFPIETRTAGEAAEALGCEPSQIVKSLVFDCDGRPVVVLVPGDRRADDAKIASRVGCERAKVASREQVERATGFEPGAVAPFPLPGVDRVLMERLLLSHEVVWVGAGSSRYLAGLAPAELRRLARADAMDVIQAAT